MMAFAHVGNTRLYLVRNGKTIQLTTDHTEGQKLVDAGNMSQEDYYISMERMSLYNGLGILPDPMVQTYKMDTLKPNDIIIMTSDGIHYSYRSEAFHKILMKSETTDIATENMINLALQLDNFQDDASVNVIWYLGNVGQK